MLYDSGASDFADHPSADLTVTREQLIEWARETSGVESWDRLVELLRADGLDQPWTLEAWREATTLGPDGTVTVRASPLLVLATDPDEARETNERLLPRFLDAVPQAEVVRPGCRHQVFAHLGSRAGELTAAWLRDRNLP